MYKMMCSYPLRIIICGLTDLFAANFWQINPPGIWVTMYPQKKDPWIIPTVSGSQSNWAFWWDTGRQTVISLHIYSNQSLIAEAKYITVWYFIYQSGTAKGRTIITRELMGSITGPPRAYAWPLTYQYSFTSLSCVRPLTRVDSPHWL